MSGYYSLMRHFKNHSYLTHPLSVRRTRLSAGLDGDCCFRNGKFFIRIERGLSECSAIDALIHEISHCIAWEKDQQHGPNWGIAYSKAYRTYLEWLSKYEGEISIYAEAAKTTKRK